MFIYEFCLMLISLLCISSANVTQETVSEECNCLCACPKIDTVYEHLDDLRLEVHANMGELKEWAPFLPFVQNLKEKWRDEVISIVETAMKKYVSEGRYLPKAENLIAKVDTEMLGDSGVVTESTKSQGELAKNVSDLVVKVEMVENKTMEVEEELKSERRVRRHLEQMVNDTQSSLISLGNELHNVTTPVDEIMDHFQMVIFSSFEDLNKTLYEDHLQKLYYKVDGVVYQNETRKLDERLELVETELHDGSNGSLVVKLADEVKTLEENLVVLNNTVGDELAPRMTKLEGETLKKDHVKDLEEKIKNILNSTELFRKALVDVWSDIQDFKSFQRNLQKFSKEWTESLKTLQIEIEDLKNKTSLRDNIFSKDSTQDYDYINDTNNVAVVGKVKVHPVGESNEIDDETEWDFVHRDKEEQPTISDRIRIAGVLNSDNSTCVSPNIEDPHLLADVEELSDGRQALIFGCRPVGRYAVRNSPIPVRCEMGSWRGPFASCLQLPDEASINRLANLLKTDSPCFSGSGEFPDTTDCTRFFKCDHGRGSLFHCPVGLHFSSDRKVCDYPKPSICNRTVNDLTKELKETIPPIIIEPAKVDKPNGLLGTGPSGQLIVHPRSSFTLHCLYPENLWGLPTWNLTTDVNDSDPESIPRGTSLREGKDRISLTVTAAKEEDSGTYRCLTPFGKENEIRVEVKAVHCPSIFLDEEYEEVYYRPTPEGEHRILGTTAEFQCEDGQRVVAVCMADGYWSRGVPDPEECVLKKRNAGSEWKCKPLDTSKHPHLILERDDSEKIVKFKCAGRLRLLGNSFTRCLKEGYWSHISLPKCVP